MISGIFICAHVPPIYLLWQSVYSYFCLFLKFGWLLFRWIFKSSLYALDKSLLSDMWFASIFPSLWLILLSVFYKEQSFILLIKFSLSFSSFRDHASALYLETHQMNQISHIFFPKFYNFMFNIQIYGLWFILDCVLYKCKIVSRFMFLHRSIPFFRRLSFLHSSLHICENFLYFWALSSSSLISVSFLLPVLQHCGYCSYIVKKSSNQIGILLFQIVLPIPVPKICRFKF